MFVKYFHGHGQREKASFVCIYLRILCIIDDKGLLCFVSLVARLAIPREPQCAVVPNVC